MTSGLLYKSGHLEVDPYARSVPLGEKRKRGRPKKIPNCLVRSPIRVPSAPDAEPEVEETTEVVEAQVKKTTRKRKRNKSLPQNVLEPEVPPSQDLLDHDDIQQSPVSSLLTQAFLKPGLGASKPPKKKKKAAAKEVDQTVDRQTAKQASKPVAEDVDRPVMRPPALQPQTCV